ncbi:aminodeoxychorismate synthase component I [Flagellimonas nanhaiensis]|uniref:aminodeoxychorismate synthase n=1 Tax=Flagellimonas nanhaiensis TaxID=2292706 RepID=A0A371JUB8_9FLAO|nr:aminodeoxychorismate synthase component I [Allomuricauda nanhaiensis]RDY61404.1 aminodeoxychorismate synthase component I [Allomuricauda nanhaiensis]
MRKHCSYSISPSLKIKDALLEWSKSCSHIVWLDSNRHSDKYGSFDAVLAISEQTDKSFKSFKNIDEIELFVDEQKDWLFGYFSYDFKNSLENLDSENFDGLGFPEINFFQPTKVIVLDGDKLKFSYLDACAGEMEDDFSRLLEIADEDKKEKDDHVPVKIKMRIHKDAYFEKTQIFLDHIQKGDIYEANFCQEFYAENTNIDPFRTYKNLNSVSKPPFASFMKLGSHFLMCASPERYLKKNGQTLISQPIKGTAPRGSNAESDKAISETLAKDPKERAENIMITDLVRNDLSRSALKGSVKVEELCEVYTYEQVHQLVSTVTAKVPEGMNPVRLIKETFPMGSMTGAPKISAMKIIEELEETKRGLYSGAVGYFSPNGDFDFNVVIRSILYNAQNKYVSFSVGSAITAKSDPEKEYEECLLKAKAMRSVLEMG